MPKKQAKNAYFYFMLNFREEERKKGRNYANLQEVQKDADPAWRECKPSVRAHFENIAKEEKAKHNIPAQKFTTFGVPFSVLEEQERLAKEAVDQELKDIQNFVCQSSINKKILDEDIYVIDVNALCECNECYVFGEVTIVRFNIRNGIKNYVHKLINPPSIPIGYASSVKMGCEEFGLEYPDSEAPKTNYLQMLATIVAYLKESDPKTEVIPPLYTLPEKEHQVTNFIGQLCHAALEDESVFRVYKLDILFFYMMNSLKRHSNEGLPRESLALAALRKDAFKYTPGIGCKHHESGEKPTECCKSRAQRWVYTILDSCCNVAGVAVVPGKHLPADMDVQGALSFKQKKAEELRQPAARAPSSASSEYGWAEVRARSAQSTSSSKRTMKPIRKPTIETMGFQSTHSDISHTDFPPLRFAVAGRGSGRVNVSDVDLQKLDLNK